MLFNRKLESSSVFVKVNSLSVDYFLSENLLRIVDLN